MPHFSRLTDIITCSLTEILRTAADPAVTLQEIIGEMTEGLEACRRNVRTSTSNSERLKREIAEYEAQVVVWKDRAKQNLAGSDEDAARNSLRRKVEMEDLIAGLRPELDGRAGPRPGGSRRRARYPDSDRRILLPHAGASTHR